MTFNEYMEQNKKIQAKILSISLVNAKIRTLWATYDALYKRTKICDYNIKNSEFPDYIEENKRLKQKYYKKMSKIKEKVRFLEEVLDILKQENIDTPYGVI